MRSPALEGSVITKFVIGRDGAVVQALRSEGTLPDPSVGQCIAKAFYALMFPSVEQGIVTSVYPLTFENAEDSTDRRPNGAPLSFSGFSSPATHHPGTEQ